MAETLLFVLLNSNPFWSFLPHFIYLRVKRLFSAFLIFRLPQGTRVYVQFYRFPVEKRRLFVLLLFGFVFLSWPHEISCRNFPAELHWLCMTSAETMLHKECRRKLHRERMFSVFQVAYTCCRLRRPFSLH